MSAITILGLDASTSTIGHGFITVIDRVMTLDGYGFFKPPKEGNLFERLKHTEDYITKLLDQYQPNYVALEDIILYMPNKSSAITITSLAILNRTVGLTVLRHTQKTPELINTLSIKHTLKKVGRIDLPPRKTPSKEDLPEIVSKIFGLSFPYFYKEKGKNKGRVAEESYDVSDGICAAITLAYKLNFLNISPSIKKLTRNKTVTVKK